MNQNEGTEKQDAKIEEYRVLTCVYCGMEYPAGTPPHGSQVLTDHIKVCPEHPLRESEEKIEKLRKALIDLVGAEDPDELRIMEDVIRGMNVPEMDKVATINAINALLETAP